MQQMKMQQREMQQRMIQQRKMQHTQLCGSSFLQGMELPHTQSGQLKIPDN